jgi:sulfane dehydrogenase subunit SoxC
MRTDERPDRPAVPLVTSDGITPEELQLAARNHGMPLEALAADITPVGLHYLLIHFDVPFLDEDQRGRRHGDVDGHAARAAARLRRAGERRRRAGVHGRRSWRAGRRGARLRTEPVRGGGDARDVILAYEINGRPLPPQHGAPLRLLVPGWYGMTSVKWLRAITAVAEPFEGFQMDAYRVRRPRRIRGRQ